MGRTKRRLAIVLAVCAGIALLVSCTSDGATGPGPETTGPPDAQGATPPPAGTVPAAFDGSVEDFYVVPDPLPPGAPGDLIRVMPLDSADPGYASARIMYRSVDGAGRDRAVTGTVRYPVGDAPDDGWPVLSWAHGTAGLAPQCAPSRYGHSTPRYPIELIEVATDYIGLGPVGERHAYLSRESEGHSVIDAVRAARILVGPDASARWLSVGHSQGGHGAQSAHELGDSHAPELELLGTVSYAPAAMFTETYGGIDPIVSKIVGIMGLYGVATEEPDLDPDALVSAEAAAAEPVLDEGCLDQIIATYLAVGVDDFYDRDPYETEPARTLLEEHDVGNVAVEAPLLLVSGTADERVVIDRVDALFDRLCATGQRTELVVVDGATHDDVIARTTDQVTAWLAARLAGRPASDSCAPPGD